MLKLSPGYFWRRTSRLVHYLIIVGGLSLTALGVGVLSMRYWVLPNIMQYHDRIQSTLGAAIGQKIELGRIHADWDGFRPHLVVDGVRILDKVGQVALELETAEATLSWTSMLLGRLSLYSLDIDHPSLLLRRDAGGLIHVAGVPLSSQQQDSDLADWLLYQRRIVIREARLVWVDEQREAPPLVLDQVVVLIENRGSQHRFALRAMPPAELASPLDVRGDLVGRSFDRPGEWRGEFFVKLDRTEVQAWRPWVDLPSSISRGRGGVRAWMGLERGELAQTVADLALVDVVSQLSSEVPELALSHLTGRLAWRESRGEFEVSTRQLGLRLMQGTELPPTDFFIKLTENGTDVPPHGEIRASRMHLPTLLNLSQFFPLAPKVREQLQQLAPQGQVNDLRASWDMMGEQLRHYQISGHFEGLGLRRAGEVPGFSGLSGDIRGTEQSGSLSIRGHQFTLDAPLLLREPLAFPEISALLRWQRKGKELELELAESAFNNADVSGSLTGTYQTMVNGPGILELDANLLRAEVSSAARYIPRVALDSETHEWLATALLGGQADNLRLKLRGDLNDFPFYEKRKGEFKLETRARNVTLKYAPEWPKIENALTELRINGPRLEVSAATATTLGGALKNIKVVIPDIASMAALLEIRGEFSGATRYPIDFIQNSPVRGYIEEFTDGMTATGEGHLDLDIRLPLSDGPPVKVVGGYEFFNNDLSVGEDAPALRKVQGKLLFTESGVSTENVVAQFLGGPASIRVETGETGALRIRAGGRIRPELARESEPMPLLRYLRGETEWNADVSVQKKRVDAVLTSSLQGLISDLPAPFAKSAEQLIPLRLERKSVQPEQDSVWLRYGEVMDARLHRQQAGEIMQLVRGQVSFGSEGKWPDRDGLWIAGKLPEFEVTGWGALASGDSGLLPQIAGIDLEIGKLIGAGHRLDEVRLSGRSRNEALEIGLASDDANGTLSWSPQGSGSLVGRLKLLRLESQSSVGHADVVGPTPVNAVGERLPRVDVAIDHLSWNARQIGRIELLGQPQGRDWQLQRLRLNNPEGVLEVDGMLQSDVGGRDTTKLNLTLQINDAGKILDRSGYPNSVKQGSGTLSGSFFWQGGPAEFNYRTLDGTLRLEAGRGQFMKIEPGIGKLLSILSLQALPKRITLDFKDVFSEGFQFDSITGDAKIQRGMLRTDNFSLEGSSARVTMKGEVDLDRETQNLRIRILPTVGNSVSLVGALVVNPVVGLGTFLANKLFSDPLDKLMSFEYNVTGTWLAPNVVKVGQAPVIIPQPTVPKN